MIIGADIDNLAYLGTLRLFLTLKAIFIVVDKVESIFDPQGQEAGRIYSVMEELSQFRNIWLCAISRISTISPNCEIIEVPTLSMGAARDTFYRTCEFWKQADPVNNILMRGWENRRAGVSQTGYNKGLTATSNFESRHRCSKTSAPTLESSLGSLPFSLKLSTTRISTGSFRPLPTERTYLTNVVSPPQHAEV